MKRSRRFAYAVLVGSGAMLLQGCPAGSIVGAIASECVGSDSISQNQFDDLNVLQQLLYDENSCGRFEPASGLIPDLLL